MAAHWAAHSAGGMVAVKAATMDALSVVAMDDHWVDALVALTDLKWADASAG